MAKEGKNKLSNIVVWIILALLIIGLAGFGATNFGNARQSVASVGTSEISINRYARALDAELRAYSSQLGRNLTLTEARSFGIDQQLLGRLLTTAAIQHETDRIGLSAGDETLAEDIRARQEFQGLDGSFDSAAYDFALQRAGMSVSEFEQTVRSEIAGGLLQAAVSANATMPPAYSDQLVGFLGEKRSFAWVELTEADLATPIGEPDEAALQAFYDADPDAFMLPEQRDITYAWLSPADVLDQIEVSDEELRALYDERADIYDQPERRLVERLVFGNTDAAQTALDQITSGAQTFEEIVETRGLSLEDIDLGDVSADELGASADAVFALDEPGVVGPVETDLGPALFRINGILAARVTPFEDVEDELRDEYAGDRARRLIADQITEFDDLLAGGATVEELADEAGMTVGQIMWTPESEDGIAAYDNFADAAAQATIDDFPEIIELSDGGVFALRLNEVIQAQPEPFADATERVAEAWAAAELQKALNTLAEELAAKVNEGTRLSALGYITSVETQQSRTSFLDNAPADLITTVFATEPGIAATVEGDGVAVVAVVDTIHAADPEDADLQRIGTAIEDDAAQSLANDLLVSFTRAVQNEAGITVNQAALTSIQAQFP